MKNSRQGFTLIELLMVVVIIGILAVIIIPLTSRLRGSAQSITGLSNLRQLAQANLGYASDHGGQFVPATSVNNRKRWHGERESSSKPFDPSKGYLAPYLGESGRVKNCPRFDLLQKSTTSFELGTGGYGYNSAYIGGTPQDWTKPTYVNRLPRPARTVMFASTAFAVATGPQEYAFTEPYESLAPSGQPNGALQPSTHFRHDGKAHIAWCDGHVTAELPNSTAETANYYGGDSRALAIGWFGPADHNGYWNPNYPEW
ncbi:prepilin-type N-terminal cleavage/methylation domain-containing protein [Rariglobus hedericola]|uniref:Prepilin-type N-terminal cleavage/methylation domain-containing protein n=1 Tax=Rariglobus hedericola TaxID=2597822 RepID=A0A556QKN3_9BACT|nr:prepilin-type N-terminal cleavage/methylation domain-containing protein [Rariglobus hedericola]TSJ77181.1 prepilin-type N-terminal cleavage/methylation domain-containing protein [Rariglobus hedericola]